MKETKKWKGKWERIIKKIKTEINIETKIGKNEK